MKYLALIISLCVPWTSKAAALHNLPLAATKPWQQRTGGIRSYKQSYNSHFLDWEECRRDRRTRVYQADMKSRRPGRLSWSSRFLWMNVGAFLLQALRPSVTSWGINLPEKITRGQELYRLITPIFLHGGVVHLGTNMMSLSRVGGDVERLFGSGRFVATYLVAGIAGNLASAYATPNPSLGASGAVFGVMGAYFCFLNRNEWLLGRSGQQMTNAITQTVAANLLFGALNPVIDNWAHLGGAVGGAAVAYWFGPRLYLTDPTGLGGRVVVDRPMIRLPKSIESLPGKVNKKVEQVWRRVDNLTGGSGRNNSPWRRSQRAIRRDAPNRSIKPRQVD